jgi:glycosyltransferase involved in cell wall biosynthesis
MSKFNPLDYPVCLSRPLRIVSPLSWVEHIPFAMFLVEASRPRVLVELGTHSGNSYFAFCQTIKSLGYEAKAFAIDTWAGDPQAGYYGPEILADVRAHHDVNYGTFSRLVQSTFDEALSHFEDKSIDLLHIDGLHTYEAVKHDFEAWLPKISDHGIVVFHDTNVREGDFGVWRLWEELSKKHPSFEFAFGHGLGVLAVGQQYPKQLDMLLNSPESAAYIRQFFYEMGFRLEAEFKANELQTSFDNLKSENILILQDREAILQDREAILQDKEKKVQEIADLVKHKKTFSNLISELKREFETAAEKQSSRRSELRKILDRLAAPLYFFKYSIQRVALFLRTRNKAFLLPTPKLFWPDWYLAQYQDLASIKMEPYVHYLMYGTPENRNPNPFFDAGYYLKQNPDVLKSGQNPLLHYARHGWKEKRNPSRFFDVHWYLLNNSDVSLAHNEPLDHYLINGWRENRKPSYNFSARLFFKENSSFKNSNWVKIPLLQNLRIMEIEECAKNEDAPQQSFGHVHPKGISLDVNKHTILFVGHDAFRAGSQMVLLHLLRWFRQHTSLNIYILLLEGGVLEPQFREIAPTLILSAVPAKTLEDTYAAVREFCNGTPDLIYCNTAVIAKRLDIFPWKNVPIIFHIHELKNIIEKMVGLDTFNQAESTVSKFIAVSSPVKQNLINAHNVKEDKIDLVFPFITPQSDLKNGRDKKIIRKELGLRENGTLVFGCGTMDARKGIDIFIDVANELLLKGIQDFHFYWIGSQMPESEQILGKYLKGNLKNYVTFLGEKEVPSRYFAAGDIFILPSREDPFPLVCLEAAECGLPVICFDKAGGMPSFVQEDSGFVTPYLNVAAMADKVSLLIKDHTLREKMGIAAKEKVQKRHFVDAIAPRVLNIVQNTAHFKPTVSVIVPCFNHAGYLPKRLESIFNQSYRDIEVILLDDASKDNTANILREYEGHPNVSIEINTENSGSTFAQWIKGMKRAKGDIIWIAEDDDYCEPDFLEKLLPFFNDPEVKLAYSQSYAIDENSEKLFSYLNHTHEFSPTRWQKNYIVTADEEVNAGLAITNTIPNASAVLFRPFDWQEWSTLVETMKLAGDWLFYLSAAHGGKVAFSPEHLNNHRRHANTNIHRTQFSDRRFKEIVLSQRYVMQRYNISAETNQKMKAYTKRVWDSIYPDRKEDFEMEYNSLLDSSSPW